MWVGVGSIGLVGGWIRIITSASFCTVCKISACFLLFCESIFCLNGVHSNADSNECAEQYQDEAHYRHENGISVHLALLKEIFDTSGMLDIFRYCVKAKRQVMNHAQSWSWWKVHYEPYYAEQDAHCAVEVVDKDQRLLVSHLDSFLVFRILQNKVCELLQLALIWLWVIFHHPWGVVFVVSRDVGQSSQFDKESQDRH